MVCASAGNFGQGIAYAARALGIPAVVFASRNANPGKVARMRALGAEVVQTGDDFDAAREAAEATAASGGGELVTDGLDPRIAAGAGTMAVELTEAASTRGAVPAPAVVAVPSIRSRRTAR